MPTKFILGSEINVFSDGKLVGTIQGMILEEDSKEDNDNGR